MRSHLVRGRQTECAVRKSECSRKTAEDPLVLPSQVWAAGELIHRCSGVTAASPEFDLEHPDKSIFRFDWMDDSVTA